jgi:hypothetical protein
MRESYLDGVGGAAGQGAGDLGPAVAALLLRLQDDAILLLREAR